MLAPPEVPRFKYDFRVGTIHQAVIEKENKPSNHFILVPKIKKGWNTPFNGEDKDTTWIHNAQCLVLKNAPREEPILSIIEEIKEGKHYKMGDTSDGIQCVNFNQSTVNKIRYLIPLLNELWRYQPARVSVGDSKPMNKGLMIRGFIVFDVWQIKDDSPWELVIEGAMYRTDSNEVNYINPINLDFYISNMENISKILETKVVKEEKDPYLSLRKRIFNY